MFVCRFYTFMCSIKYNAVIYRVHKCHSKIRMNLRILNRVPYVGLSRKVAQAIVFSMPITTLNASTGIKNQVTSTIPTHHSNKIKLDSIKCFLSSIWDVVEMLLRSIQLMCTFTPLVMLYPLTMISYSLKSMWYKMLLLGIGISGPIIIKLGQWASTRRDLFSKELCFYLSKLQRRTSPHSWYYTRKCFEYAYGPSWEDIFVEFDNKGKPIGSGCCAQVYKAWIRNEEIKSSNLHTSEEYMKSLDFFCVEVLEMLGFGLFSSYSKETDECLDVNNLIPVAIKVRHPQMERRFRQDLNILKFLASTITLLMPSLRWLSLCECVDDFSQVMESQVNFYTEAENMKQFTDNFKDLQIVKFPSTVESLTRSNILVQSFEEGQHIDDFTSHDLNEKKKKKLALMGVNTVLKMVFQDNFIHGDMHPGNILVQEGYSSKQPQNTLLKFNKELTTLVILDCGIVSSLDERGKKCLKQVFAAVVHCDGERVAELFLENSNHECTDVQSFKMEMKHIVENALSKRVTLHQTDVAELMNSLFSTMINHKVKVDSKFSSVILAIMVIEGLGRSLDPSIDIVERAKPFLLTNSL